MMHKKIELKSKQDTRDLAAKIAPLLGPGDVIRLYGDLGSGKTFFASALGRELGVDERRLGVGLHIPAVRPLSDPVLRSIIPKGKAQQTPSGRLGSLAAVDALDRSVLAGHARAGR